MKNTGEHMSDLFVLFGSVVEVFYFLVALWCWSPERETYCSNMLNVF